MPPPHPRIRLPRTQTRRAAIAYAKVLEGIATKALDGFGFEGKFRKPGQWVTASEMPAGPWVLLECTESEDSRDARGRKTWEPLYVLWRWDSNVDDWVELCRAAGFGALRYLTEPARAALGPDFVAETSDWWESAVRLRERIRGDIEQHTAASRLNVLTNLLDFIGSQAAEARQKIEDAIRTDLIVNAGLSETAAARKPLRRAAAACDGAKKSA